MDLICKVIFQLWRIGEFKTTFVPHSLLVMSVGWTGVCVCVFNGASLSTTVSLNLNLPGSVAEVRQWRCTGKKRDWGWNHMGRALLLTLQPPTDPLFCGSFREREKVWKNQDCHRISIVQANQLSQIFLPLLMENMWKWMRRSGNVGRRKKRKRHRQCSPQTISP